jgi:hypothetical protein
VSQTSNSSQSRTELAEIALHPYADERHEPSIMSQRSGSPCFDGTPALFSTTRPRSRDAPPLPRAWRQRTRSGDVARHEEAGMRARMSV